MTYIICLFLFFFFFSSRRRHTRFDCDWSSDVCSSDLRRDGVLDRALRRGGRTRPAPRGGRVLPLGEPVDLVVEEDDLEIHVAAQHVQHVVPADREAVAVSGDEDRKSTRLNSSHSQISYAVFCLKKKQTDIEHT